MEVDHLARFVRWLEQRVGNVVLLHGAEPARSRATIARAVNAVHAFFDYHATRGLPVARWLVSFSRTPKPHWRNPQVRLEEASWIAAMDGRRMFHGAGR